MSTADRTEGPNPGLDPHSWESTWAAIEDLRSLVASFATESRSS